MGGLRLTWTEVNTGRDRRAEIARGRDRRTPSLDAQGPGPGISVCKGLYLICIIPVYLYIYQFMDNTSLCIAFPPKNNSRLQHNSSINVHTKSVYPLLSPTYSFNIQHLQQTGEKATSSRSPRKETSEIVLTTEGSHSCQCQGKSSTGSSWKG